MRVVIVAAHPDDETIGASALLARGGVTVIHVTDGAPHDPRWWTVTVDDRESYARLRGYESERAFAHVGARRIVLGLTDGRVVYQLGSLERRLAELFVVTDPELVVTHAYEGGHPDHDAVAVAVVRALALSGSRAPIYEMALYHGAPGSLVVGEFVGGGGTLWPLDARERALRAAMLDCFASQALTLAPFRAVTCERFRPAPRYDFARPPHPGPLWYERAGFPISGVAWRAIIDAGSAR